MEEGVVVRSVQLGSEVNYISILSCVEEQKAACMPTMAERIIVVEVYVYYLAFTMSILTMGELIPTLAEAQHLEEVNSNMLVFMGDGISVLD